MASVKELEVHRALVVTLAVLVFCVLSRMIESSADHTASERQLASQLTQQANKWHEMSMQDKKALASLEHAIFAIAYLNAARHISHDASIEQSTGISVHTLMRSIVARQQQAMREMGKQCPKMKSKSSVVH